MDVFIPEILDELHRAALLDLETIVKPHFTNSDDDTIIGRIVKLYHHFYSEKKDVVQARRKVKQLFTIASSEYGFDFLEHLHRYGAYTDLELEKLYGISKQTARYIREKLVALELVEPEQVAKFDNPDPSKSGPKPGIWVSVNATDKQIRDAEQRYYSLTPRKGEPHKDYSSIVERVLSYIDDKELKDVDFSYLTQVFPDINYTDLREVCNEINRQRKGIKIFI